MKISDAKKLFNACYEAQDSVLMTGVHGIGKTEVVREWAKENNIYLVILYLSNQ
jgi:MoxR-like ATPase